VLASFEELEARLVEWAVARDDLRSMVVIGSRATPEGADEWSDLDVVFTTTDRRRYLGGLAWVDEIAEVWLASVDPLGRTRHVLFAGGLDAGITPLSHRVLRTLPAAQRLRAGPAYRRVPPSLRGPVDRRLDAFGSYAARGARVVVDKDGAAAAALAALPASSAGGLPSAGQFRAAVDEFLFVAVWNAKHLRRGELVRARLVALDGRMKALLLDVVAWHARATRGPAVAVEDGGRHLERWADARIVEALATTVAGHDEDELWRASLASVGLFLGLAEETAERLGWPYDAARARTVTDWLARCEAGRR